MAQSDWQVAVRYSDPLSGSLSMPDEVFKAADSSGVIRQANRRLRSLYAMGYLAAGYDLQWKPGNNNNVTVNMLPGQIFTLASLSAGNLSDELINKAGIDIETLQRKPFSFHQIARIFQKALDNAENNGYPFASIKMDSLHITGEQISGQINYQSGPQITFDSLHIVGDLKVKTAYLMAHLGIYKGGLYDERIIEAIPQKIKLLSFVALSSRPEITIVGGKCHIKLALQKQQVSRFDGILGILPNQNEKGGLLITGRVNLDLHNLFSSGKRLLFIWQNYDANSQLLNIRYEHPNLFRTPVNITGDFELLKQDTSFLNRELGIALSMWSKSGQELGFHTRFKSSRLISTTFLKDISSLPDNTDYNLNYYGLNYYVNKFDNLQFPTQGWMFDFEGLVGQKKIIRNYTLPDSIYRGVSFNSFQFTLTSEVSGIWKIYKNLLLYSKFSGGYLQAKQLFQSDLFRLGGLKSLRGFLENEFYASAYGLVNVEVRAVFSGQTYFMLFYDQAVFKSSLDAENQSQHPAGLGAGFSFNTTAGIFNFVFALGHSQAQPLSFDYSKVHFGYTGRF